MAPQSHPRAQFVPIPPDLDLNSLVENTSNFDYVTRLPNETLREHSRQSLDQLVLLHVIIGGKPLVIEGWGETLDPYLFSPEWLQNNVDKKPERVRDISNEIDIPMTIGHYIESMGKLTSQFTSKSYRDPKRQRLYLKDMDTPDEWARALKGFVPEIFYYLNDCIESRTGGDGAILEPNEYGQMRYGKGVAPAGDLMSSLPVEMQALNMMCYIGHEGTYTPAHREMCASLGHNIMVDASTDEKNEKAGSSIWFMTETNEREVVSEYFLSMLGHDIEVEKHFAQINAWKKAPFNVWVVEQKVGDLILIPPLAPHQVWNRGTRTMKAAWNRTTVDTLELAINEALPRARMVCRDEQYKNKAIIYYTLIKYHGLVTRDTVERKMWMYGRVKQLFEDFKRLFALFTEILVSEMFSAALPAENDVEFLEFDSNITCSYCRCNIWNRFLTCKTCIGTGLAGEEDTYDICMDCYAMGRSCGCISNFKWVEQWSWSTLSRNYEIWRQTVVQYDGFFNVQTSPQPLEVARKRFGKKPVAQICQEQLKIRPWRDINISVPRSPSPGMSSDEPDIDDSRRIKKTKGPKKTRGRIRAKKGKTSACHVCCHHHYNWKMAFCTTCSNAYCYGVLWRAFDLMPQQIMEDRDWSCPKCLVICSCGKCRKSSTQTPYAPKGTLLGHDTRKVADFRSVESLVDFSKTNLGWLRGENDGHPQESARMKKLREKVETERNREVAIDENCLIDDRDAQQGDKKPEVQDYPQFSNIEDIDPELRESYIMHQSNGNSNNQHGAFYDLAGLHTNGVNLDQSGDATDNYGWLDSHYDLESTDAFNRSAGYPSGLLASVASMKNPLLAAAREPEPELEQAYLEPSHQSQKRMMGAGYYQQGSSGDKIVYDPPSLNDANDDTVNLAIAANNPNLALSDLLPLEERVPKKRKFGHRSDDKDDVEFFISKRARKLAETKQQSGMTILEYNPDDEAIHKQPVPRRNVSEPKTNFDLGEETLLVTDDDIVVAHTEKKFDHEDRELKLATQAISPLTKKHRIEKGSISKRRSIHRKAFSANSVQIATNVPRKSAWLARKEVEEAGKESTSEAPKKKSAYLIRKEAQKMAEEAGDGLSVDPFKRRRRRQHTSTIENETVTSLIEISSFEESDHEGDVRIGNDDSLLGVPDTGGLPSDQSIQWDIPKDLHVQVGDPRNDTEGRQAEKAISRRRGRPPKQVPASVAANSLPLAPTNTRKLLSLKEKLALEGKAFKIVAKKPPEPTNSSAVSPNVPPARSIAAVIIPKPGPKCTPVSLSPVTIGPSGVGRPSAIFPKESPQEEFGRSNAHHAPNIIKKDSPKGPQVVQVWNEGSSPAEQPVKKGPTVVRLDNLIDNLINNESYGSARSASQDRLSSSDDNEDDNESIPAVRSSLSRFSRRGGSSRGSRRGVSNGIAVGATRTGPPRNSS